MEDNTFLAPLSPIQRSTPSQRINFFKSQESTIYNKISPYYQAGGGVGPNQPFVYTKLTDSNFAKNLTRYDSQAVPAGSTVRDVVRMTKFSVTGTGVLYLKNQLLLQQQNAFNETRIYNPLSLLKATAKPGSLGLIDYPQRHLETSGGLLNFFKDALLSTFGFSTKDSKKIKIEGTASEPLSNYVVKKGGAKYGLMRFNTGNEANSKFKALWGIGASGGSSGGSQKGFLSKLVSLIPSTNPLGAYAVNQFGQKNVADPWKYRPEYDSAYQEGVYFSFLEDRFELMTTSINTNLAKVFYNDLKFAPALRQRTTRTVKDFHRYTPGKTQTTFGNDDKSNYYASLDDTKEGKPSVGQGNNIENKYDSMLRAMQSYVNVAPQNRKSTEGYKDDSVRGVTETTNYNAIPSENGSQPYYDFFFKKNIAIENKKFAKATSKNMKYGRDNYNALPVLEERKKRDLVAGYDSNQSEDLIFFYFYDLVNKRYIPFRATLSGITDQHSPQWEELKYMGRADSLFIYKGFTRDVNFSFKVYANSIYELIPMWERVNYLVGLTRPSKYTGKATATAGDAAFFGEETDTTGLESQFIYPPMMNFRIGDLYVDQPAVLNSVNVTIPDDATWETLRNDDYEYYYGIDKVIKERARSRQLPNIIDVSVSMRLLEKQIAVTTANHFGPQKGWDNTL